jgi:hypothetical protein
MAEGTIGPPKEVTPSLRKMSRTSSGEPVLWRSAAVIVLCVQRQQGVGPLNAN